MFNIIVAIDKENRIGTDNKIPWNCPEDKQWVYDITTHTELPNQKNVVIMGKNI